MDKVELILMNISGLDRPGVTSALTEILARHDARILDIGQADIHHSLSLGILFRTSPERSGDILKDLLFKCYELSVKIRFTPVSVEDYEAWVSRQGKNRWIITILGRQLTARHIALVTDEIARQQLNIDGIQRLTGRMPLDADEEPQSSRPQCHARPLPAAGTTGGIRHLASGRQCVPPLPPSDMLRYGLDSYRD